MSDNNTPWVVDVVTREHWGLCHETRDIDTSNYKPYAICRYPSYPSEANDNRNRFSFEFEWWYPDLPENSFTARYIIDAGDSIVAWAQQTYDATSVIAIDYDMFPDAAIRDRRGRHANVISNTTQERFEVEAEAVEFAESQSATPIITFNDGDYLFRVSVRQRIEGVYVYRTIGLQHTGDPIEIHNVNDLENYYASAMGMDTVFNIDQFHGSRVETIEEGLDCEQSIDVVVFNLDNPVPSTITVEPDFQGIQTVQQ